VNDIDALEQDKLKIENEMVKIEGEMGTLENERSRLRQELEVSTRTLDAIVYWFSLTLSFDKLDLAT
jgi:predicted  nucleic acid-binding Zn-ribbon protein